jgi:hypothetical protein
MPSTPVMILVGCVALLAWKTGALANLMAKFRGHQTPPPPPTQIRSATQAAVAPSSVVENLASSYDSSTLGLAFHKATRREADEETARTLSEQNRAAAVAAYQAPFSAGGVPAPPPPVPPSV